MFTIKVFENLIGMDLLCESSFNNMDKYKVDLKPTIVIKSIIINDVIKSDNLIKHTTYYDLYKLDDGTLYQIQKEDDKICGTINYKDNEIIIGLFTKSYVYEYLLTQYAYVYIINKSGGMLMHGSSIKYKNKGIIFTAPSGTGKSTHSRLWQKYSDCEVINDDKNSLKLVDDKIYLYPSPWSGKHRLDNNIESSLDAIVFLYQNKTNEIKRLRPIEALKLLMPQLELLTYDNKELWNKITDKLIMLPCYRYGCNMEREAFDIIHERLCEDLCL